MEKYFDSHTHLNFLENKFEIIKKCEEQNIKCCIVGVDIKSCNEVLELSKKSKNLYYSLGIHPQNASLDANLIETLLNKDKRCVAIGECGLDYYYDGVDKEVQKNVFIKQIELATKYKLPLIIHCRDAYEDLYSILLKYHKNLSNILIHCFDTTSYWVEKFNEFNCFFAIGGKITYEKNAYLKEALLRMPLNRILTETDSPWLTPKPFRGSMNTPLNIICIVNYINEILQKNITKKLYENSLAFFKIKEK